MSTDAALAALARLHGVRSSFVDAQQRRQEADADIVLALLRALGVRIGSARDAPSLLEEESRRRADRRLEPVLVHRIGEPDRATVTVPSSTDPEEVWLTLTLEDGTVKRSTLHVALSHGHVLRGGRQPMELAESVIAPLDFTRLAGGALPPGRHRLTLEGGGAPVEAVLLSAPRCPTPARQLGAFMPLHAIRAAENWGVGTYPDLERLGAWLSGLGVGLLGTLPLYPAFLEPPADPSPYMPVSRLAYNEVFIDPVDLPEFGACAEAQDVWTGALATRRMLGGADAAPYEEVSRLLRQVLEPMSRCVCDGRLPARREALEQFAHRHPELQAYAEFRARREEACGGIGGERARAFHLYCQWAAYEQLTLVASHASLLADFPVGSHPDGFDPVWSPASFVPAVHGGAPPDFFFPGGQNWGFSPLHPEAMREDGYAFLTSALARVFLHAACVRIDHVMGLQRLYMIPEGSDGRGTYVEYHVEELHALVSLEALRAGCVVVGEDLGTVPPEVRPRLARDGILRTWVFQFESTEAHPLPSAPGDCLAALGTHDLPRFAAYLWGEDITSREEEGLKTPAEADEERGRRARWRARMLEQLGIVPPEHAADLTGAVVDGCLTHLARSAAALTVVDLEDLWGERARQNVPGTGPDTGNWRHRSTRTLEQLEADDLLATRITSLVAERAS